MREYQRRKRQDPEIRKRHNDLERERLRKKRCGPEAAENMNTTGSVNNQAINQLLFNASDSNIPPEHGNSLLSYTNALSSKQAEEAIGNIEIPFMSTFFLDKDNKPTNGQQIPNRGNVNFQASFPVNLTYPPQNSLLNQIDYESVSKLLDVPLVTPQNVGNYYPEELLLTIQVDQRTSSAA
jgi:hypothetical protein